jgi:hypothetical protein
LAVGKGHLFTFNVEHGKRKAKAEDMSHQAFGFVCIIYVGHPLPVRIANVAALTGLWKISLIMLN